MSAIRLIGGSNIRPGTACGFHQAYHRGLSRQRTSRKLSLCLRRCGGGGRVVGVRKSWFPVATPSVTLAHDRVPLGSPVDITYRFEVAADAPAFTENYRVFVGVVDPDEELMWTDDHDPEVPTTTWKPGQKLEYTRTVFVPVYPYVGDASIHMGLYSPTTKKRVSLSGQDVGQHTYKVGKLQLLPQTENVFTVYKEGWHGPETALDNAAVEWQWTKKTGTLAFRNPKKDSVFYLDADNPSTTFPDGQHVQVMLGDPGVSDFYDAAGQTRLA